MHAWINITHPGFSGRQDMPDDGDQWVSWEQMVATLRAKGEAEGRAALLAREVIELRGEVAKLKPLEMILLKVSDPVQHLSEAVLDLSAKVRQMEEASRLDQLEILRLTRCIAELQANLIAVVEPPAVVVPDDDRPSREFLGNYVEGFDPGERSAAFFGWREGRRHLRENSRAIPADRVLGDEMVAVDENELRHLRALEDCVRVCIASEVERSHVNALDALRANQGGAAT